MSLPDLLPIASIHQRLIAIFPDGIPNRSYLVRDMAARVVFTLQYIGAVEGTDRWLGPKHVYVMSDTQAAFQSEAERDAFGRDGWKPGYVSRGAPWYADTTREPIRDETLREGLIRVGAVVQNTDVPTTSGRPRYALRSDFARLFEPALSGNELAQAIEAWQTRHLEALALARIEILRQGGAIVSGKMSVSMPNGTARQLPPGPSSLIAKAVIETFAPKFLYRPAVILLSESGDKIIVQEESLSAAIGLKIDTARLLPDIILFDLEPGRGLLVFVEVVATDGPITSGRRQTLLRMAEGAKIAPERIAFVTAYLDRQSPAFRRTFGALAWNTLVWFVGEPDQIMMLRDKPALSSGRIFDLLAWPPRQTNSS